MQHSDNLLTLENIDYIENENWLPIEGFELYFISDRGRVLSLKNIRRSKLLSQCKQTAGYPQVSLLRRDLENDTTELKHFTVHKLVARHFIPGYEEGLVVNHINGDKTDNRVENLEWVTQSENIRHYHTFLKNG